MEDRRKIIVPIRFEEELFLQGLDSMSLSSLTYVVISGHGRKKDFEIVTTTPDSLYLATGGSQAFSGTVSVETWSGDLLKSYLHKDGNIYELDLTEAESNGRINYCESIVDWYTCPVSYHTKEDYVCHYSYTEVNIVPCGNYNETVYKYIFEPATGDGSGGSGSDSGSNDDNKYPAGEFCDEGYVPDGDGGCIKDMSGYLTSVKFGEDVNNPYDGMEAVDGNGVIFTYNAELNGWLMPDLQILLENGYQIQLSDGDSDFGGAILSTVVTLALIEPTPVGKIVIGGSVLTVLIYKYAVPDTTRYHQECIDKYVDCVEFTWWKDCDFYLENCNAQNGVWACN